MQSKRISLIALNLCLLAVSAQISIPFFYVPFTLQVLVINILARFNKRNDLIYTMILYMILGLIGLPIFSNGQGGPMVILSPSFGFVIGFIFYAKWLNHFQNKLNPIILFISASLILYTFGLTYLSLILKYVYQIEAHAIISRFGLVYLPSDFIAFILAKSLSHKLKFNLPFIEKRGF